MRTGSRKIFRKINKRVGTIIRNQRVNYCPAKTGNYQKPLHSRLVTLCHLSIYFSVLINLAKIILLTRYEYIHGIIFGIFEHIMNEVGNQKSSLIFYSYYHIRKNVFFRI